MLSQTQPTPSKNSLTITLTEPVVILRTVDVAGVQSPLGGGATPPSMIRGLLALDLAKASRISSIQVELQAISHASWSEGLGTSETRKIYSATQVFFHAASSNRRSLSVDPGISHYANESEHHQPPPPFPSSPPPPFPVIERALTAPAPVHVADETRQRGRRVRRRSSADHLVFQRDPVAHHNRPPAPSPLSFPPTTEEDATAVHTPTSSHFASSPASSSSSSLAVETPAAAHIPPHRGLEHSRTASLGENQTLSRSSSRRSRNTPTGTETQNGKSHRSHASLSFGSIFGRSSQPDSPVENRSESPQPTGRERGREKNNTKRHSFFSHHALGRVGEAFGLEEEHKEVGDGWQEFRKGTYTFPISFEIPSHMPTSLDCDGGSITWKLVAKARRPGVFTSKLSATREVQVVSIPAESDVETTGDVLIERPWDDQLQYFFHISGKVFTVGSTFNVKMSFMPLAKIQMYKLAVDLEERIDSYVSGMNMTRTVTNVHKLLNLQCSDDSKPLLPLSPDDPLAYEKSPLATLRRQGNPSTVVSQFLGPGPWPINANLHLPADCNVLHPTSRSRDSTIHVSHVLRFTMRLTRGDGPPVDPKTNKRRLFEVVVRTPVHILSCYARAEYTTLPRYSETLDESAMHASQTPACPCAAERTRRAREGNTPRIDSSMSPVEFGEVPSDVLERTLAYERLVSGHESVLGDAPPAYDPGPMRAAVVAV
ncbi:hypothetical protein EDB92DRAFT_1800510 [Lactarius akahatsu]|uniref:Arrestin C-terminal-like domain-containing protein n=1 Tax=Lactarius akahatsu TaxID=416441 RepID=A0AAD4LDG8_9AGAM|nr:hypothetical protein EDB92DRAFT_1800510 [Lactarius akahatsu]